MRVSTFASMQTLQRGAENMGVREKNARLKLMIRKIRIRWYLNQLTFGRDPEASGGYVLHTLRSAAQAEPFVRLSGVVPGDQHFLGFTFPLQKVYNRHVSSNV